MQVYGPGTMDVGDLGMRELSEIPQSVLEAEMAVALHGQVPRLWNADAVKPGSDAKGCAG